MIGVDHQSKTRIIPIRTFNANSGAFENMDVTKISAGNDIPNRFNTLIEIPDDVGAVKYEFDKDSGALFVDRLFGTSLHYPANYGFIPNTLSDDGDPLDVLVFTPVPLLSGCVIECRPLGVLRMEDESGYDAKVLAAPADGIGSYYKNMRDISDLREELLAEIVHFFEQYKALESGKWAKLDGWGDKEEAKQEVLKSFNAYS